MPYLGAVAKESPVNVRALPEMFSLMTSLVRGVTINDLEKIKSICRQAFPTVPQTSAASLDAWTRKMESDQLLIVDVRTPAEFAVSHLRQAVNCARAAEIVDMFSKRNPTRAVLYCSVGFRSSRLVLALQRQGHPNVVMSLEGSIFQWANEGRPLYRGSHRVEQVHPYGKLWAGLLRPGLAWRATKS